MFARIAVAALSASLALSAAADAPNIEPGNWEHTSTVTFVSEFPIPEQSDTSTSCITAEDVAEGQAFMDEPMEGCTITNRDVRADGMDYSMSCEQGEGMTMTMEASMQFNGDSMEGTIRGEMQSPMGPMQMNVTMSGRRIGDC
ncbi:DUF3617 domain-containing protein [Wenzhouxiangella marina]|uniref:Uncharacterized protein n=1 Tax=Wenzhouxiangella marina TaxID=1579979 RepID=A0A0K0Y0B5_9GAMM|nr:DUF3617 family protein [Wenzhouxiangella marina]AKS43306.1 hypothetical protein WM2015_2952 [Wenzhouxiangella marina]MBB6087003.1 hypothetical protein [Wenzhouxiangella marina]